MLDREITGEMLACIKDNLRRGRCTCFIRYHTRHQLQQQYLTVKW